MKHTESDLSPRKTRVAPRAGAGIETIAARCRRPSLLVAPRAGAGIETSPLHRRLSRLTSPPARGRGLKPFLPFHSNLPIGVAPRAGAGIETFEK